MANHGAQIFWSMEDMQSIAHSLVGYSLQDVRTLIANAVHCEPVTWISDQTTRSQVQRKLLNQGALLRFEFDLCPMNELAGFAGYKSWLVKHKNKRHSSKAILLFGVEGCGKSRAVITSGITLGWLVLGLHLPSGFVITPEYCTKWFEFLNALGGWIVVG